jgi:hypothetical protein
VLVPESDSTFANVSEVETSRSARTASRAFVAVLLVVCVAGGVGLLGGHTSRAAAAGRGYDLHLSYPGTTRPGLDALWELTVVHPRGFAGPITLAVTASYFDLFETQGFYPTPSETTRDDAYVYLTFSPPPDGDTFAVMFDAYTQPYIEPSRLLSNDATVAVVDDGKRVAAIHYSTFVLP